MPRAPKGRSPNCRPIATAGGSCKSILTLYRIERPVLFFGTIGFYLVLIALILAVPLVTTYLATGLVPRFPTAILVTGLGIIAVLCLFAGLILDTVTRGRRESPPPGLSRPTRARNGRVTFLRQHSSILTKCLHGHWSMA